MSSFKLDLGKLQQDSKHCILYRSIFVVALEDDCRIERWRLISEYLWRNFVVPSARLDLVLKFDVRFDNQCHRVVF